MSLCKFLTERRLEEIGKKYTKSYNGQSHDRPLPEGRQRIEEKQLCACKIVNRTGIMRDRQTLHTAGSFD